MRKSKKPSFQYTKRKSKNYTELLINYITEREGKKNRMHATIRGKIKGPSMVVTLISTKEHGPGTKDETF